MGFFDLGKKVKKKTIRVAARARHVARKTPLGRYAPLYGSGRTLAGTKLTPKQKKVVQKARKTSGKKNKRIIRRVWRKLV